jgi:hypothetical protein
MIRFIPHGQERQHAAALKKGLAKLGPDFSAELCYWCEGTGLKKWSSCNICERGRPYGTALGLLYKGGSRPAPESVVNQVLEAAKRS